MQTLSTVRDQTPILHAECKSTVQVTVTEDVTYTGLDGVLMTDTEVMKGTEGRISKRRSCIIHGSAFSKIMLTC